MGNSLLGQYEMVMALSEATINTLFKKLRKKGEIHEVWSIRMSYDDFDDLDPNSAVINENYPGTENPSYDEVEAKFDAAFDSAAGKRKMTGFIAQTGAPFITIMQSDFSKVRFNIPFEKGKLTKCITQTNQIKSTPLDGIVYVFVVELDKISRPYPEAVFPDPVARENVKKQIDQMNITSLKPEDFTIESLFLNFENSNFISDSAYTIDPNHLSLDSWLIFQQLLQNYFKKILYKSDNPYVLGYSITIPDLVKRADSVFEPLSLNFSTSFVAAPDDTGKNPLGDSKKCSLNYLMMVTRPPDKSTTAGVMNSLIDDYDVLGIDYDLFYEKYLKGFFVVIEQQLTTTLNGLNKSSTFNTGPVFASSRGTQTIRTTGAFTLQKNQMRFNFGTATVDVASNSSNTSGGGGSRPSVTVHYEWKKTIAVYPTANIIFPMYLVTEASLGKLKQAGLPDHPLIRLRTIANVPFESEVAFCNTLATILSPDEMNQYKKQILVVAGKPGCLVINLVFGEMIDYLDQQDSSKSRAQTTKSGAGLYINLYPGTNGAMLVQIFQHTIDAETETLTSGKQFTVNDVNEVIRGNFYSGLSAPDFLDKLKSNLEKGIKTLPFVVLPISNVYMYKAIGHIVGEKQESVITFQSTYGPEYQ